MQSFGVIGNPIAHSLSPLIHNFLFSHFKIQAYYQKFHILSQEHLKSTLLSLNGANITLPYKEAGFSLCDEVFGIAKEIGAVNTILHQDGKLIGFNTDAFGFWECIKNIPIQSALIFGAGGSAKAIALILKKQGIDVTIHNRTKERLQTFINQGFEVGIKDKNYDLLINATSAGMDQVSLPLEKECLKHLMQGAKIAFDLIYPQSKDITTIQKFKSFLHSREDTAFVRFAREHCIKSQDGLDMLLYQALYAFEIFCNQQYPFEELKGLFYNA